MRKSGQKTLSVNAIEQGTVIDHIPAGKAIRIVDLLQLTDHNKRVTIGLNLKSKRDQFKDLIKIENYSLNEQQLSYIGLFAPRATINRIQDFAVTDKIKAVSPSEISGLMVCPNLNCITNKEQITTKFIVKKRGGQNDKLHCAYCERIFSFKDIKPKHYST
ncbi:MAG: aspartate carbamoyltransferase regulatory subunit [Pseudomonadota bacterium]